MIDSQFLVSYEEIESISNFDNQALFIYIKDALDGEISGNYNNTGNRIIIGTKKDNSKFKSVSPRVLQQNISILLLVFLILFYDYIDK